MGSRGVCECVCVSRHTQQGTLRCVSILYKVAQETGRTDRGAGEGGKLTGGQGLVQERD